MNSEIKTMFEEARALLAAIRAAHPDTFEYFLQATIKSEDEQENRATSVEAFQVHDVERLIYYRNVIQDKIRLYNEAERFSSKTFKSVRVVCVDATLPKDTPQELLDDSDWIEVGKMYTCHKVEAIMQTGQVILHLKDIDDERELVPPIPYTGYASWRFIMADYTKLN